MKRLVFLFAMLMVCTSSFAQKGEKGVGLSLGYGTEIKNFKVGAAFKYNVTDAIRIAPSFDYFFKKMGVSMWSANVDAHYLFPIADKFKVYPLVGVTFAGVSGGVGVDEDVYSDYFTKASVSKKNSKDEIEVSTTMTRFGANLGAGAQYSLSDRIDINLEVKYQLIKDMGQCVFGIGAAYKF